LDRPKSINIGGHEVIIRIGLKDEKFEALEILGEFDSHEWTIDVKDGMNSTFTNQIIAHELLHGLFAAACVKIVEGITEENICKGLENQFYRFLADNDLSWFRPKATKG
jgi:hypothetical protein